VLSEIAKGVDVRRDVLEQMEFAPKRIAEPLPFMDGRLFE
jgi:propionate CoA-transferase